MNRITWRVRPAKGGGFEGVVIFPDIRGYTHKVASQGSSKQKALGKAATMAARIAQDPTVQALLPPGGAAAIAAVTKIASSKLAKKGLSALRSLF